MILLNMKKGLVCLSIIAILMLCLPNIAVATTSKYSTTFHNNVRHTGDYIPMARGNTSNSILDWKYATKSIVTSSAAPNDVVSLEAMTATSTPLMRGMG